ncbi:aldo/keto reductase [Pseudoclavibacter sp. VKM Ac-2888]|uniref:aldo/keto reductase n=1 Tax=Pseudoclavibacter sp. VKM Ac-2888 TaxID=2783830 RepID=UPI00188D6C11|nr:aldo/keto reductase [Pseudoclavibacter sp. VKM Ac-2888]MBF4550988.1 aldo/keto reductase [Pseudoclavibacter sp. VKM Ac-2888]
MTNSSAGQLPTTLLGDGLVTTVQGYGAMSLSDAYGPIDDAQALRTLQHSVDAGITFLDTANIYGDGRSESTIAKIFPAQRERIQLATKFGITKGDGVGKRGVRGDREHVREQVELSLTRLGTDHIDLYYQHRVDPNVPIEDTVGFVSELVAEGKVRHIGLSEPTGAEIIRAAAIHPIAAVQSEYSIFSRDLEAHVIPAIREVRAGFVPYSPVSRGLLTDSWAELDAVSPNVRANFPRFFPENLPVNRALAGEVAAVAQQLSEVHDRHVSVAEVALAWVYAKSAEFGVGVSPIPGTRSPQRVDENLRAIGLELNVEQLQQLDALADRVVGHRSADPAWTSQGREEAQLARS